MYYIYAIYNREHNKIYVGQTEDLDRRIKEHNNPLSDKHKYTNKFSGQWKIIYKEDVDTRAGALKRENN